MQAALESFEFYTESFWIWIGIAFLLGTIALLIAGSVLGLTYITPGHARPSVSAVNNTIAAKRASRDHDKMRVKLERREPTSAHAVEKKCCLKHPAEACFHHLQACREWHPFKRAACRPALLYSVAAAQM